jgi:hypothetical protein
MIGKNGVNRASASAARNRRRTCASLRIKSFVRASRAILKIPSTRFEPAEKPQR